MLAMKSMAKEKILLVLFWLSVYFLIILFLGVPLTSKTQRKRGKFYFKFIDSKGKIQVALLGQMRIYDIKRIGAYLSKMDDENFAKIKTKIKSEIIK